MTREPRDKIIKVRVTNTESTLAEKLALKERLTVSDLMRKRLFSETTGLDVVSSMQFLDETSTTLAQINQHLKEDPQSSITNELLQEIRVLLIEARRLIANGCKSSSVSEK